MRPNVEGGGSPDVYGADEIVWKSPHCWLTVIFHSYFAYRSYILAFIGRCNSDEMRRAPGIFSTMGDL